MGPGGVSRTLVTERRSREAIAGVRGRDPPASELELLQRPATHVQSRGPTASYSFFCV